MSRNNDYNNIIFVDTDSNSVLSELIGKYEGMTGRTLYPADPVRLFINWVASVIIQQRININEAARQNVPRFAEGEYLDSLAELFFNLHRQQGVAATVTMCFEISEAQDEDIVIESGTRVKANENIMFATDTEVTIAEGDTSVEVTATACEVGSSYNGFAVGQINKIVDPYPYCSKVHNISASGGGVDVEDDDSFYNRMRESLEGYSTAGAVGGYKYYAESADARIADVSVTSPTAGNVLIKVLLKDGKLPGNDVLTKVSNAVNADDVRPLTDNVTVAAASTCSYNIDLTYYIPSHSKKSVATIKEAVDEAIKQYISWQGEKMGRDINPSYLISLIVEAGAKRVIITAPTYTKVAIGTVALLGTKSVDYGGVEDE